jgi:hypothetical protein
LELPFRFLSFLRGHTEFSPIFEEDSAGSIAFIDPIDLHRFPVAGKYSIEQFSRQMVLLPV